MFIETKRGGVAGKFFTRAILCGSACMMFAGHAWAEDRIFPLYIENAGIAPVTATLSTENYNCYEGTPPLGQVFHISPGQKAMVTIARVQGHGCNGRQGEFEIEFSPDAGGYKIQHFDFDNDGHIELSSGRANVYPGTLSGKNPKDGSYTYSTPKQVEITAGPAIGSWTLVCQSICNRSISYSIVNTDSTTKTQSQSLRESIKSSLEGSLTMEGVGGVKIGMQTEKEKQVGEQMAQMLEHSESNTDTLNYTFSPEQMKSLGVFAVWQWIATIKLSDNSYSIVKSNKFTCTPDGNKPDYLPGSAGDVKACRGG